MIESYSFGKIVIDGKNHTTDVVIFPDHVQDGWWRKEGHKLRIEDLKDVLQAKPEVLVVGTGYFGSMKVPNEVREHLASMKIQLIVENTKEAYKTYNRLAPTKRTVAAFHLTC
jgi:hypothetical protein